MSTARKKRDDTEKISIQLARLQERLENLIESNSKQNQQLLIGQKELCEHVNHELEAMDTRITNIEINGTKPLRELIKDVTELVRSNEKRITILENKELTESAKYKGRMELFKWISVGLSITLATSGVLGAVFHFLGMF